MEYLYRDANNYKSFGSILLSGNVDNSEIINTVLFLEPGDFFVAEQLNIPPLYTKLQKLSNGPTNADHAYHEFLCIREATEEEVKLLNVWGEISELMSSLRTISMNWDCRKSVHCIGF